jgi:two-component system NtrC family sensor kinase
VAQALALVSHQPRFRNFTLRRELAPAVAPVLANEGQIRQVFLSLLLNALEATPGHGALTVRTLAQDESDGPKVAVEFQDQGTGIAPEHLPRIFEPFFTTKAAGKGTGLGLAICQGIVTEHGGRIEVQSQPGAGSTFRVILPAAPEPATASGGGGTPELG